MIERIGILGGGQLAQMLAQAAISLGMSTVIFEREADSPASRLTQHAIVGQWNEPTALDDFVRHAQVVTLENEFVDAKVLAQLEARGVTVYPSSKTLTRIQDKLTQKECMAAAGIAIPAFRAVATRGAVNAAGRDFGWPVVLKARRDGYDGHGNATLRGPDDIGDAWERLGGDKQRALFVEAFVPFTSELAVMVARSSTDEVQVYPVVQTEQRNHICHRVLAPAPIDAELADVARDLALRAVAAVDGVGIFGVELFLTPDGILFNEMAPRPHNSGHYTIEGCVTSQFENHLRAVLGLPLGSTAMRAPAAVMVNLLGQQRDAVGREGNSPYAAALAVPDAHLHLYGKREVRPGRKMGHITALGNSLAEAAERAGRAVELVAL